MVEYYSVNQCVRCNGPNDIKITDTIDYVIITEAETICRKCGHKDYFAHGYYESKMEFDKNDN